MSNQHPKNTKTKSKILFVRHGTTESNKTGYLAGSRDVPLANEGVEQAKALAQNIIESGIPINKILSSPLARAFETAAAVALALGIDRSEIIIIEGLKERCGGSYEGGPIDEFYDASDLSIITAGGEGFDMFADRVLDAGEQVRQAASDSGSTLVVGHAEFYRMAKALELGLPAAAMMKIDKPQNSQLHEFPARPQN